jgi:hypothetical protein
MDIDWNKPYGVIYGAHEARYEQNNVYFDAEGKNIEDVSSEVRNKEWAKKQKGLGGRNLLIFEAKNLGGIVIDPHEKIDSIRKKVMDRLPA